MEKNVAQLLNDQINKELYSAYLYLDMSNYYADAGLSGFADWYRKQAQEEQEHALKIYDYLHDNGEKVTLEAIAKPALTYQAITEPAQEALKHEQYVTSLIHNLYAAAVEAKDYRTQQFLVWFINEQGEEEKNARDIVDELSFCAEDKAALYLMNSRMGKRD